MKWFIRSIGYVMVLVVSAHAQSLEYVLESELAVNAQHDDNVNLEVNNQDSLYGEVINPAAALKVNSENISSVLDVDLKFSDFNRSGYDSDDQYVTYQFEQRGERYSWGFTANAIHDTTRTSEGEDSGRFSNSRRKLYSLAPNWTYYLTSQNLLTIQLNATTVDYDDLRYVGYEYGQAYGEWTYIVDEKLKLFVRGNGSRYESDERTQLSLFQGLDVGFNPIGLFVEQSYITSTDTLGFQLGAGYQFSEKISFIGLFGRSDAETEYEVFTQADQCNNTLWLIRGLCDLEGNDSTTKNTEATVKWEDERQYLTLKYSIQTQPSSDGYVLEYESLKLKWKYRLSPLASVMLDTTWGENEALDGPASDLQAIRSNREFVTVTAAYSHKLNEQWYINATLRYRKQEREINPGIAEGLGGQIGVTYYPGVLQW